MARDQVEVDCPISTWTELTNANVTALTFQVIVGEVWVRYTTASAPTDERGLLYTRPDGELTADMVDLTYLSGAQRVFAKPAGSRAAVVLVDHA